MEVTGKYIGAGFDIEGNLQISFQINEKSKALEELNAIKGCEKLNITAKKYRKKKSDQARKYFWVLVGELTQCYKTDNFTTYLMQLRRWGVTYQVRVIKEALDILRREYRYIEVEEEYEENGKVFCSVILFPGISLYNTQEMSRLIEGTVEDCHDWGIVTLTPEEIKEMELAWKGGYCE